MSTIEPPSRSVFLVDAAGNVQTWNPACAAMFGIEAAAILGHPATDLFAPAGRDAWSAGWPQLIADPDGAEIRVDLACAGGRILNATLTLVPQADGAGAVAGCAIAVATGLLRGGSASEQIGNMPLSALIDMFPATFYVLDRDGGFVLWNRNLEQVTELAPADLAATRALDLLAPAQRALAATAVEQVFRHGVEIRLEVDYVARSGRTTPLLLCGKRLRCNGIEYLFGLGVDISERRLAEQRLRLRERALHATSNGIIITRLEDNGSAIEYVNPAFEHMTGYAAHEIAGKDPRFMAAPGMDTDERLQLRNAIAGRMPAHVVLRNLRKNGELFWNDLSITPVQDEHGATTHYIGVLTDVTATKLRTARLEHQVNHDALTGLANRNLLWDRLEQALHLAQRQKSLVATVLIDLDGFKTINDTFGHEAGDVVLKVVARRLQASVRDSDTVARLSGDEFVLILASQPSLRFTLRMVERVRQSFAIPVAFGERQIPVRASVGVSLYPHDGASAPELVRAADLAMYHGKGSGRSDVHFFSPELKSSTEARHRIELALHGALERDELFLLYQPRVAIESRRIAGLEALLRWRHPDQGVLLPAMFLAHAEDSGIIVPIGERVLDLACAFEARLHAAGIVHVPMTVNLSWREYSQPGFLASLAACLQRHALPPRSLQLDLRIDGLIRNPALGRELAEQLHVLGVDLSVDGFGAGLCDLGYLQQLAASQVKLAHATVHALADGGEAVAKSLIDIGHNLNMEVVAEAVETPTQLDFLASHGCDQFQGMWFSAPLVAEAAQRLLEAEQPA